jgi:hypothetical protein
MTKSKISIFLVDDQPQVREYLVKLIHQQPDLIVRDEAEGAPLAWPVVWHGAMSYRAISPRLLACRHQLRCNSPSTRACEQQMKTNDLGNLCHQK